MKDKIFEENNLNINLMNVRLGNLNKPIYKITSNQIDSDLNMRLKARGGYPQQDRMIKDKRKSLDKATLYSYQAAWVRLLDSDDEVRALINSNKLKLDYDDKVISIGFEHGFKCGDVFEWCNTNSYWLIYLQDLTELAYFRGDIRKCSYEIEWQEEGEKKKTYAALRGPVETKIDYIQKHQISVDRPNFSLNFMVPKNMDTLKFFKRYNKFYLKPSEEVENVCWRIEAVDAYSSDGVIEVNAVEYYANKSEDDIENGITGAFIKEIEDPNLEANNYEIEGETFIKPKVAFEYSINRVGGEWVIDNKLPIKYTYEENSGKSTIRLKWNTTYSGQFDIQYKKNRELYTKTIVVNSLF